MRKPHRSTRFALANNPRTPEPREQRNVGSSFALDVSISRDLAEKLICSTGTPRSAGGPRLAGTAANPLREQPGEHPI